MCPKMRPLRVIPTSEPVLYLVIVIISLQVPPGRTSSLVSHDKAISQSRTAWCKQTNACAGCEAATNLPRCFGHVEPLLGADLCGCCFSCVKVRDLGESCGSQLSVWSEGVSAVTILAVTLCREGLVCVNFACHDLEENVKPAKFSSLITNEELLQSKTDPEASTLTVFEQDAIRMDTSLPEILRSSIPINNGDLNFRKPVSSTSSTPIPSSTQSSIKFNNHRTKETQPCYAADEETIAISSYPSDDLLGRFSTVNIEDKRFGLVDTGNLLTDLAILLSVVDTRQENSSLDKDAADSLVDRFSTLISGSKNEETFLAASSEGTAISPNSGLRKKRQFLSENERGSRFNPPKNIGEILIRGASAHKEYIDGGRGYVTRSDTSNRNESSIPGEPSSQEDESTVRVQITSQKPGKVQTLIDLEDNEEEEEETEDEENRDLQLANRGRVKDAGRLPHSGNKQGGVNSAVPRGLETTTTTQRNLGIKKTPESRATDVTQDANFPWNQTLTTFNDRLTLVEDKMGIFEQVLEELVKWCNPEVSTTPRDCIAPQRSGISFGRWGSESNEDLALASGIDAVRLNGNRRKSTKANSPKSDDRVGISTARLQGSRRRYNHEPRRENFFRTIVDDGFSRDRLANRRWEARRGRGGNPSCRNRFNRGSSLPRNVPDDIGDPPVHRTVQRSVSATYPLSEHDEDAEVDGQLESRILQETQIPGPATLTEKFGTLGELENRNTSPRQVVGRDSTSKKTTSMAGVIPSWKLFVSDKKEKNRRRKRSDVASALRRGGNLFERELTMNKGTGSGARRSRLHGELLRPLIVTDVNSDFNDSPATTTPSQTLFGNSDIIHQTTESTATIISTDLEDAEEPRDPRPPSYTITSHGNSTIRIEEIRNVENEENIEEIYRSSVPEDDFDHIYESLEAEEEVGEFDYDVRYDDIEYTDASFGGLGEKGIAELKWRGESIGDEIHTVSVPQEEILRTRKSRSNEDDQWESERLTKREIPLVLFGSSGKRDPKTIVWPSKWVGYQRDKLQIVRASRNQGPTTDSRFQNTGSIGITKTPSSVATRTTGTPIMGNRLRDGETYVVTPKVSTLERRGRKNRRKLVWR